MILGVKTSQQRNQVLCYNQKVRGLPWAFSEFVSTVIQSVTSWTLIKSHPVEGLAGFDT